MKHTEPDINPIKMNTKLRLSKNIVAGKRYDVYIVSLPVEIARQLKLPIGLTLTAEYNPERKNQITLRWENGTDTITNVGNGIENDRELVLHPCTETHCDDGTHECSSEDGCKIPDVA